MAYDDLGFNQQAMSAYEEEERRRRENPTIGEAADQALDRFKGKFTDSNGDFSMGKYVVGQMTGGGMNQPTAMEKQLMQGAGVSAQPGFMTGAQPGVAPVAPQQAQQPTMQQAAPQPVNPQQSTFADRVAQNESGAGGYDAIFGYGNAGGDPSIAAASGGRNLSQLSIGEALQLGDSRMSNNAGALGKYQFLPSTLRGLMGSTGLTENDKFDGAAQEKLFQALTSANATSLERQGIQPNENNLALAQSVGAGGAAKLLDPNNANLNAADVLGLTGAGRTTNPQLNKPVSEYLADMNAKFGGGQQRNVASVGREMGMDEPGYGGTEALPIDTAIKQGDTATILADAHSSVEQLAGIVSNPDESKLAKQVALNRMKTLSDAPVKLTEANKTIAAAGEGDASATRDVNNALKPPKDGKNEGSWLKALLLAKLGLGEAATREFALLGIGSTEHDINIDGKKGIVTMDAKGNIVKGYVEDKDGNSKDMSAEQIAKANQIAMSSKNIHQSPTERVDPQTGRKFILQTSGGGAPVYKPVDGGAPPTAEEQKRLEILGVSGTRTQAQSDKLNNVRNSAFYAMQKQGYGAGLDILKDQYNKGIIDSNELAQATNDISNLASKFNIPGAPGSVAPAPKGAIAPTQTAAPIPDTSTAAAVPVTPTATPAPAVGMSPEYQPAPTSQQMSVAPATITPRRQLAIDTEEAQKIEAEKRQAALGLDTQQQKDFLEYSEKDITPKADAGSTVARVRKQQINGPDGILNNPEIAGLLQGQGSASKEALNIVRDLITGNYKDGNDLSRRVASLDLNQRQKDVLNYQIGLQAPINAATLKLNSGAGAISDAEQKANRDANIDISRQGLYSGLTLMTRDQFSQDVAVARSQFRADNPQLKTTEAFNAAWRAESSRLNKQYDDIYTARAKYISKYNGDGKNPGAVVEAFKYYPVPEYNSQKKNWDLSQYSASAARPPLTNFVK